MMSVAGLAAIALDGPESARLCQLVENRVVGAPCGSPPWCVHHVTSRSEAWRLQPIRRKYFFTHPALVLGKKSTMSMRSTTARPTCRRA